MANLLSTAITGTLTTTSGSTVAPARFTNTAVGLDFLLGTDGVQSQYTNIVFYSNSGNAQIWKAGSGYSSLGGASSLNIYNSNGAIAFHPNSVNNAMFIATSGNVGIGTTAPTTGKVVISQTGGTQLHLVSGDSVGSTDVLLKMTSSMDFRGRGILMTYPSSTGDWFAGVPYTGGVYAIGYSATQPEYKANAKLLITSAGNVGIGTASPVSTDLTGALTIVKSHNSDTATSPASQSYNVNQSNLYLFGRNAGLTAVSASGEESIIAFANPFASYIGGIRHESGTGTAGGAMKFQTGGANERMRITSAGNVGIGTTSPSELLHISGASASVKISSTTTYSRVDLSTSNNQYFLQVEDSGWDGIGFYKATPGTAGWQMIVNTAGNVGIGTTSPAAKLDVAGDIRLGGTATYNSVSVYNNSASGGGGYLAYQNGVAQAFFGAAGWYTGTTDTGVVIGTDSSGRPIRFYTNNEKMRITGGGNVGIGTTSPSYKLDVSGQIRVDNGVGNGSGQALIVGGSGDVTLTSGGSLFFGAYDYGNSTYIRGYDNSAGLYFYADGTLTMNVAGNGNVGIGTTSPAVRLDYGASLNQAFHLYTSGLDYYGINMTQYDSGPYSTNIFSGDGGQIKFRTATGGTTQSTRMTITAAGNVGIGTTSPSVPLTVLANSGGNAIRLLGRAADGYAFTSFWNNGNSAINGEIGISDAQNMLFYTGASERMRINSAGRLIIGRTADSGSPFNLQVDGRILQTGQEFLFEGDNDKRITVYSARPLSFATSDTERMRITGAGSVGIGTTSPQSRLDLGVASSQSTISTLGYSANAALNIRIPNSVGDVGQIVFTNDAGPTAGYASIGVVMTSGTGVGLGDMVFATKSIGGDAASTERMRINSSGYVGIGVTSIEMGLQIGDGRGLLVGPSSSSGSMYVSPIDENTINGSWGIAGDAADLWLNYRGYRDGFDYFRDTRIGNGKGTAIVMVDGSAGNVGIGTTAPAAKLDVVGVIRYGNNAGSIGALSYDTTGLISLEASSANTSIAILPSGTGNVGIKTLTPTSPLEITNTGSAGGGYSMYNAFYSAAKQWGMRKYGIDNGTGIAFSSDVQFSSTWYSATRIGHGQNANNPSFQSYYTTYLATTSGNVGIATTSPTHKLNVYDGVTNQYTVRIQSETGNGAGKWMGIGFSGEASNNKGAILFQSYGTSYSRGRMIFALNNAQDQSSAVPTDAIMSLEADGKVGIGTTSPGYKLSVAGSGHSWNVNPHTEGIDLYSTGNIAPHYQTTFDWYTGAPGAGTFRMRLTAAGNLGIGTTSPSDKLDVSGNARTSGFVLVNNHSDNTLGYRISNTSGSSVSAMFVNSANALVVAAGAVDQVQMNKKVYLNAVALGVNVSPSGTAGRIDASNDIVAYSSSDERLKHNIAPIENALGKVKSLTGVEFDWKPEYKHAHGYEGHDTGIIAQQVQDVMPTAVRTNDTGFLAVRYEKLIGLLIEGMKEQQAQIDELKAKLDGLTK